MARPLTCTLVTDGSSDRVLVPLLQMLLDEHGDDSGYRLYFAELRAGLPLDQRIKRAIDDHPCHLLFIHRDAERQSPEHRNEEIQQAMASMPQGPC